MMNNFYNQNPYNSFVPSCYQQPSQIVGRFVNDFGMITANDVPMNGQSAVFPKSDLSEIEVRQWGNNGLINKITYVPKLEPKNDNMNNVPLIDNKTSENGSEFLTKALEDINNRLDSIEKAIVSGKQKKEVQTNEQ